MSGCTGPTSLPHGTLTVNAARPVTELYTLASRPLLRSAHVHMSCVNYTSTTLQLAPPLTRLRYRATSITVPCGPPHNHRSVAPRKSHISPFSKASKASVNREHYRDPYGSYTTAVEQYPSLHKWRRQDHPIGGGWRYSQAACCNTHEGVTILRNQPREMVSEQAHR